ncbi:Glyoxalase/Bleomycin resistance protein/Dihydroxybiphenyl dioxygenase [Mycena sp. CBHHK59/15]|nr:Glyoxalase/Bleomycin resistance protein/Dihydroxybiphenyl dioxygenase [Mycena sp. CBHHK59/15]
MIITSCDHTGITVCEIERSLAFWTDVMGCKLAFRIHSKGEDARCITGVPGAELLIAMLDAPGGHRIELMQYRYLAPADRQHFRPRPCDVGNVHVAFTVDNIDEMLAALLDAGCVTHGKPRGPPGHICMTWMACKIHLAISMSIFFLTGVGL